MARSCCSFLQPQPLPMALRVTPWSVLAVPDKPEQLWLDPNRGSLRWSALPSCNGVIIGYQVPRDQGRPSRHGLEHCAGTLGTVGKGQLG